MTNVPDKQFYDEHSQIQNSWLRQWGHMAHWEQHRTIGRSLLSTVVMFQLWGGSVAEWLACWTQAQKGLGSNRSRDAVG